MDSDIGSKAGKFSPNSTMITSLECVIGKLKASLYLIYFQFMNWSRKLKVYLLNYFVSSFIIIFHSKYQVYYIYKTNNT